MGGGGIQASARQGLARSRAARWVAALARALAAVGTALMLATGVALAATPASATASGWHLQPVPDPPSRTGSLAAVSCTSPTACLAVGSYLRDGVFAFPLAETWNGTSWSVQKPPAPANAETAALVGISCVSATACVAVGNYRTNAGINSTVDTLAETWNGTSWSVQPTPTPTSPNPATLTGVSCTSARACIAVGTADGFEPLAEAWNGTSWSLQKPPAPAGATGGVLSAVSCTPGNACIAVGNYQKGSAHALLAERWDGTAWSLQQAAAPPGAARSYLNGVSCRSADACTAVGSYQSGKFAHVPLAEAWNGSSWSIQRTPGPAAPRSGLSGVACRSASSCAAVGSQTSRYQVPTPLAEAWNDASWSTA